MKRELLTVIALDFLAALMVYSFLSIPWRTFDQVEEEETSLPRVTEALFAQYPIALIIIALLLATSMVAGVFLAKMEGRP